MKRIHAWVVAALLGLASLAGVAPARAGQASDGSVVLRMCRGADKVRALSVMCHSYLNGYLDGARHYARDGKLAFCLDETNKEQAPAAVVQWITEHPEAQSQPAGTVLHKALSDRFPCKGRN